MHKTSEFSKHRLDIDGLRALAVLPVVAFHAFPAVVAGGFVGVDIFFVISGYLISGILLERIAQGTFSFADFYARRARRIFPSLVVVLLFCYALGWFYLLDDEFRRLGAHILWGAGFLSNFKLWAEAGYFDRSALSKPLLHFWSLGIEEQFYLLWPALLYYAAKRRGGVRILLALALVVSFATNAVAIGKHPVAVFFSPLTRFWELLIGGAIAYLGLPASPKISARLRNWISGLGFFFIAAALICTREGNAFPGWRALLPTLGAAFLIAAGPQAFINRAVLSVRPMVAIGLVSYPLYLWHWPLLSFARIIYGQAPALAVQSILIVVSFLAAWLTYRFVEIPLRFGGQARIKVGTLTFAVVALAVVGGVTARLDGLPFRQVVALNPRPGILGQGHDLVVTPYGLPEAQKHFLTWFYRDKRELPTYAIWGDSRADALFWGLVRESRPGNRWQIVSRESCAPRYVPSLPAERDKCAMANHLAFKSLLESPHIRTVVLISAARVIFLPTRSGNTLEKTSVDDATKRFEELISALRATGRRVILVADNPVLPDPSECLGRRKSEFPVLNSLLRVQENPKCNITYDTHLASMNDYWQMAKKLRRKFPDLLVYDPAEVLCDMKIRRCPAQMDGHFLYSYQDHISDFANEKIAARLLTILHSTHDDPRALARGSRSP